MEVQSAGYGAKNSAKYLYWHEVEEAFARGYSLVIYQHFRREKRVVFVKRIDNDLRRRVGETSVESFRTAHALFLVAIRPEHADKLKKGSDLAMSRWSGQIYRAARAVV
jgi:hypothetical protein